MPELPDIELYRLRIADRTVGTRILTAAAYGTFVLRTAIPPLAEVLGKRCDGVERIGKRIVLALEEDMFVVFHLMISGRFTWRDGPRKEGKPSGRVVLAEIGFEKGTLGLQEVATRKRASIHVIQGRAGLAQFSRGGLDLFSATQAEFLARLSLENRTLKRALTSPAVIDGVGNAYSDEILHAARLSPLRLTRSLSGEESGRLLQAARSLLGDWCARLPLLYPGFPKPADVTAFRLEFAVHGRYGLPCPDCGSPVQRVVYAENETSYCAKCQNEGRLLADRALSRLLKADWPRTLEEMVGS